jgi:hypothetical protein
MGYPGSARGESIPSTLKTLYNLHERFPNLKVTYLSSRICAGYAATPLNPEPHAFERG